MYLKEKMLSVN
uniref:Uncharacterized protein n=1 Tax=Rhizophora mucronata TaxID=61149 RepID=A0A2P2NCR1_RHIMU